MSIKIIYYVGMIFFLIGLLYPLGLVNSDIVKYLLYIGVVAFGLGIILMPGVNKS